MIRNVYYTILAVLLTTSPVLAKVLPFPDDFKMQWISTNGARIYVRVGGTGPAVVLLHGFAETGDMWAPLAIELARDHEVIVPDLRGLGLSSHPVGGYDKKTQAGDVAGVLDALKVPRAALVTHDIGNMVGYAFAAFDQDAKDNEAFVAKGKLTMPVLAIGGEKSFGPMMAVVMRAAAVNVKEVVIPNSGHWLMEEQPRATIGVLVNFLDEKN